MHLPNFFALLHLLVQSQLHNLPRIELSRMYPFFLEITEAKSYSTGGQIVPHLPALLVVSSKGLGVNNLKFMVSSVISGIHVRKFEGYLSTGCYDNDTILRLNWAIGMRLEIRAGHRAVKRKNWFQHQLWGESLGQSPDGTIVEALKNPPEEAFDKTNPHLPTTS